MEGFQHLQVNYTVTRPRLLCGLNEQHPAAGPTPVSRKMLPPWPASTDIYYYHHPNHFLWLSESWVFFTLGTTLPTLNTCTSPYRNVGGTQISGEPKWPHAGAMPNQAAEAQPHHIKLRLQYFVGCLDVSSNPSKSDFPFMLIGSIAFSHFFFWRKWMHAYNQPVNFKAK